MNKKGVSAVVATILMILITTAGVVIVWTAIIPMIKENLYFNEQLVDLSIDKSGGYTAYDSVKEAACIQVKRGADDTELTGIQFVFNFNGNSKTYKDSNVPEPNQGKTYCFNLSGYGKPNSISLAPIINNKVKEISSIIESIFNGDLSSVTDLINLEGSVQDEITPETPLDCIDADLDGFNYSATSMPECGQSDCNDNNVTIKPNSTEICNDGIDNDCNSLIDCNDTSCSSSCSTCNYTFYVDYTNGNDANNGSDSGTAWKTISKVNSMSFNPGSCILFKKGEMWREQLILKNGIGDSTNILSADTRGYNYYGSYGAGAKPIIMVSKNENQLTDWTDLGSNIWQNNDTSFTIDVGNIIFNNGNSCANKQMNASPILDHQGDFWYDHTNNLIKIYSVGNPASVYTSIECALTKDIIDAAEAYPPNENAYIIIDGLDLRYGGAHGIWSGYVTHHMIIRNCDISFIGGGDQYGDYSVKYGNGIEFFGNSNNNLVEKNNIWEIYDGAFSDEYGGSSACQKSNEYIRNNIIWNSEHSLTIWTSNVAGSSLSDIYLENNTCINAGSEWGANQRPDGTWSWHIFLMEAYTNIAVSNLKVQNNIFSGSNQRTIYLPLPLTGITVDYNLYYQPSGNPYRLQYTDYANLSVWRTATNQDAHSIAADPLFVDLNNKDFMPVAGSPACNMSSTGSYVGALPCA